MPDMTFLHILLTACLLDLLLGDPRWLPHPVRGIGWLAAKMEDFTRRLPLSEHGSGRLTVHLVLLCTGGACAAFLLPLALLPHPVFAAGAALLLCAAIAARDLLSHALRVHHALGFDLNLARKQVALMVGRDTERLDEAGVVRACVESVAENMSDGIIAPLFWAAIGATAALPAGESWSTACGATAAMLYKAVNTMDSMFGYKNERYRHFGRCPARLDDVANLLPARISGLAIVLAAPLSSGCLRNAWRILRRDCKRHSSPNSGWPEAAAAGAFGIQLGGDANYFGRTVHKPTIGEPLQSLARRHIPQTCRLIAIASLICLLLFVAFLWLAG